MRPRSTPHRAIALVAAVVAALVVMSLVVRRRGEGGACLCVCHSTTTTASHLATHTLTQLPPLSHRGTALDAGASTPSPRRAATASPLTIDLFIRTYTGDAHWLIYLLRSFERFLHPSAYRTLHVVTDDGADAEFVTPIVSLFPALRARVVGQTVERWMTSHNNGSYHAQVWAWVLGGKEGGGETASWAPTHPPTHPPTLHTNAVQTQRRRRRGRL